MRRDAHVPGSAVPGDDGETTDEVVLTTFAGPGVQPGLHTRILSGATLAEVLSGGPLSVACALRVGIAVVGALEVAHRSGDGPRNVRPANVVVGDLGPDGCYGSVTLVDFGFARSPGPDGSIRDDLVGTVRYLSPEQAGVLDGAVDERSDLYATGVLLYECLAGRPPFEGDSVGELLRQLLNAPVPDLRAAAPDVPPALAAVVHRLLRTDPAERYQTAAAVAADLQHILATVEGGPAFVEREATRAAEQLHVVEERERIARDLHDVVIQRLFAVGLGLDALAGRMGDGPEADHVAHATDELHQTIRDIRGTIFSLRSDEPGQPLLERLEMVFSRAEQAIGFAPEVEIDGPLESLPTDVRPHLLATLNEALANVARHARATYVQVRVRVGPDELVATVIDDGVGLPPHRQESGLANLRRRAELVGGVMTTEPAAGELGLVLTWRAPLFPAPDRPGEG